MSISSTSPTYLASKRPAFAGLGFLTHWNFGMMLIKDTLKAFNGFKNKQKSVWNNVFWYVKVCILLKCIQYTIHWDKIDCGAVVITAAQLHSSKSELRLCASLNPARGVSETHDGEDLWQWSRLEIRLNVFRRSTILQKQFIIVIFIIIIIIIIKTQILKKFPSEKINRTKNALVLLSRTPTHHSFTL